jgi:protein-S-isoprenylcysteine O-methyltransferase Ste14
VLQSIVVAAFLAFSIVLFVGRSVYESKKSGRNKKDITPEKAESATNEPLLVFGALFALVFYAEMILYVILVLMSLQAVLTSSLLQLAFPYDTLIQTLGIAIMVFGYFLIFWGYYTLEYDKLVTWGPYRHVRHPVYLGYFIVFAGFLLTLLNLVALLPLLGIPGEVRMATIEEQLLTKKYGEGYAHYQQETGKFFPKKKKRETET